MIERKVSTVEQQERYRATVSVAAMKLANEKLFPAKTQRKNYSKTTAGLEKNHIC